MSRKLRNLSQSDSLDGLKQKKIVDFFVQSKMNSKKSISQRKKIILPFPFSDDESSDLEISQISNTNLSENMDEDSSITSSYQQNLSPNISSESSDTTLNYSLTGKNSVTILENVVIPSNSENKESNKSKRKSDQQDNEKASTSATPKKQKSNACTPEPPNSQSSRSAQSTSIQIENLYIIYGNNQQVSHSSPGMDIHSENLLSTPIKMGPKFNRSDATTSSGKSTSSMTSPFKGKQKLSHSTPKSKKKLAFSPATPSRSGETSGTTNSTPKNESMAKPEDEKFNLKQLDCMKELYKSTLSHLDKRRLLKNTESKIIEEFLEMNVNQQYLIIKLFLYLPKWYHLMDFCERIKLNQKISAKETHEMYDLLRINKFIYTDLNELGIDRLLDMGSQPQLKSICKKYKLQMKSTKKEDLIKYLKENCRTQRNLSTRKTPEDVLKERILECLGIRFKLAENIRLALQKAYLVQVFTNSDYIDPQVYFKDMNHLNVAYIDFKIENYCPFLNNMQFSRFVDAMIIKTKYFDYADKKNYEDMKILAEEAFSKLKRISPDGKWPSYFPNHLRRFSAEYQYISILNAASKRLTRFHGSVKIWLEYLIEHYNTHHALGYWYKQLAHIFARYSKDHEAAATTTVKAFEFNKEKKSFDLIQIYELSSFAMKLWGNKQIKLTKLLRDKLSLLSESPINSNNFRKSTITGRTDRNSRAGKRIYTYTDENGDQIHGSVENLVINYYKSEDNFKGIHCEGRLLETLFVLLFWDIIYYYYVPNTFISKLQDVPLDMFSDCFFKNREQAINERIKKIAEDWSLEKIETELKQNWDAHSHEKSFVKVDSLSENTDQLCGMFRCINRKVLAEIFRRLATNFKRFRSGLPDLFLWKSETSECKFVEVKGEGDKLSLKQMLWIQYLMDIGACVEVCHVTGVGAKKIKQTQTDHSD